MRLSEDRASRAEPAVDARNGVVHAIAITAEDGRQALRGSTPGRPTRYTADTLLRIAGELAIAARQLPPGSYGRATGA